MEQFRAKALKNFEQSIDDSPAILWITELDGSCSFLSQQWFKTTGQSPEQALAFGWLDVIHPDDLEFSRKTFGEANRNQQPFYMEYRLRNANGDYRWSVDIGNPRFDSSGNFLGFTGTVFDIHEQKMAATDLELKSNAIENSLNGFDIVDENGQFVYVNQAYVNMWGYDNAEEVLGTSPVDHCADPNVPEKIIRTLKSTGQCDIEFLAKRKDGSTFHVRMLALLAKDSSGREIYPTTSIDITQQKENEAWFRNIVDSMPQMAFIADASGAIQFYNQRHYEYFGIAPSDQEGWSWASQKLHHPDDLARTMETWKRSLESGEVYQIEYRLRRHDGEFRWHLARAVPIRNERGKITQWLGTNTDIHDQKTAEASLLKAKDEAERANQLKSAFLANMSHEIRTPLGAMVGFADLLRDKNLTDSERSNYLEILIRNGHQLSVIINDILDLSKVEAGHLTFEYSSFDPRHLLEDVVASLRVRASKKNLELIVALDADMPKLVISDPNRTRQVLMNLLGNAIKFTPSGKIEMRLTGCKIGRGRDGICFEIRDTGIGIPQTQKQRVFEMFVQADESMTRQYGGTGLGLALSRSLARELGGDVVITETELGKGTTVAFSFENRTEKTTQPLRPALSPLKKTSLSGVRVLVVDDSQDNQELIGLYLKKEGIQVQFANNGSEAFEKAMDGEYEVLLMDIQMPIMDGYTATEKLRSSGYRKPIIALTAHALSGVRTQCLNVGCNDHLSKPINPQELIGTISRVL